MDLERKGALREILESRQREIVSEVGNKLKERGNVGVDVQKDDIQEDIEFALLQMKTETLNKIKESLRRLEEGIYGLCALCGSEIAAERLWSLPFAVNCKSCEEACEAARQRELNLAQRRSHITSFFGPE